MYVVEYRIAGGAHLRCGHQHRTYSGAERCYRHHLALASRDQQVGRGWYASPPWVEIVELGGDPELETLEREAEMAEREAYWREQLQREAEGVA